MALPTETQIKAIMRQALSMQSISHYTVQRVVDVAANIDGRDLGTIDAKAGSVFALRVEGDELVGVDDPRLRVPCTHAAKNVGSTRYREILVETK